MTSRLLARKPSLAVPFGTTCIEISFYNDSICISIFRLLYLTTWVWSTSIYLRIMLKTISTFTCVCQYVYGCGSPLVDSFSSLKFNFLGLIVVLVLDLTWMCKTGLRFLKQAINVPITFVLWVILVISSNSMSWLTDLTYVSFIFTYFSYVSFIIFQKIAVFRNRWNQSKNCRRMCFWRQVKSKKELQAYVFSPCSNFSI